MKLEEKVDAILEDEVLYGTVKKDLADIRVRMMKMMNKLKRVKLSAGVRMAIGDLQNSLIKFENAVRSQDAVKKTVF